MITTENIRQLIEQGMPTESVEVSGGEGKYIAEVISQEFSDLSLIKRHKLVYACVNDEITSGALHALTIVAKTPAEVS
ncbi:MAG: BolA/IbaG family iron-sulfur metabolism protein [Gammaproteobacteria bacterium]|nr:BolA/IbaG family iron-sulfur metabolism protein [Gammaproteobacteria bacterium]